MALRDTYSRLAAMNGGTHSAFSQARGLQQVGATNSKGICQAYCFYDNLRSMSGQDTGATKKKAAIEWSLSWQTHFETGALEKWDLRTVRNKYNSLLSELGLNRQLRAPFIDYVANLDELMGFIVGKRGYFHFLMPTHVTGAFVPSGARGHYFDPNFGIVDFQKMDHILNFISDYHSSGEFNQSYVTAAGDKIVVHVTP
jgi:hypothetical protein